MRLFFLFGLVGSEIYFRFSCGEEDFQESLWPASAQMEKAKNIEIAKMAKIG